MRRLSISLATLLIALAACEIGLRIYLFRIADAERLTKYARFDDLPPEAHVYRGHPFTNYCLNEEYESRDGKSRHNALGLRGPEIAEAKASGVYRIVCIGGSTTYCTEVRDDALTYPAQLERILRERHGHANVEVINAGVGGWSSWECLVDLEMRLLGLEPDLLVVYHGINDVYPRFVPPEVYRRDGSGRFRQWSPGTSFWEHSVLARCIGVKLGWSTANTIEGLVHKSYPNLDLDACLDANPPEYFAANLESTIAVAKHAGIDVMLATFAWCDAKNDYVSWPAYQRAIREGNEAIRAAARKNGVPLFEFETAMDRDKELWADSRHVNADGARVMAELYAAFVHERFFAASK